MCSVHESVVNFVFLYELITNERKMSAHSFVKISGNAGWASDILKRLARFIIESLSFTTPEVHAILLLA